MFAHLILNDFKVSPSVRVCVSENKLHFLQLYDKMSLIKVARYVLRVKNMQSESSSDPWGLRDEEKLNFLNYVIRQGNIHFQTRKT